MAGDPVIAQSRIPERRRSSDDGLNGIDPLAWLAAVLTKLPGHSTRGKIRAGALLVVEKEWSGESAGIKRLEM